MKSIRLGIPVACCMALLVAGCASYYRVIEPVSGRDYYTMDIGHYGTGSVTFEDDRTGAEVTLQSSEVIEISQDEFRQGTRKGVGDK